MTKKTKQRLQMIASSIAGQLPFKPEVAKKFTPVITTTLLMGYYLGTGRSEKSAAKKAQKVMSDMGQ